MRKTEIKVKLNRQKRTATIRRYERGECTAKYRTSIVSKEEYDQFENMTQGDWEKYLLKSNDYIELY